MTGLLQHPIGLHLTGPRRQAQEVRNGQQHHKNQLHLITTSASTTSTSWSTETTSFRETTTKKPLTEPVRDCKDPYSLSFETIDAWSDGLIGRIIIPNNALRLDNFGEEYTIIFDMVDDNHDILLEVWNVDFFMPYYGGRGWVYHSGKGDKFVTNSFAFLLKNVPNGFSRKT